jgi:hypothetical protein
LGYGLAWGKKEKKTSLFFFFLLFLSIDPTYFWPLLLFNPLTLTYLLTKLTMCPPLASSSFCFLLPPPILILFSSLSSSLFLFCFNSLSACLIFFWFIYNFFFTICPWGATSLGFVLLCKLAFLIVAISTCNHHLERYTLSFFN